MNSGMMDKDEVFEKVQRGEITAEEGFKLIKKSEVVADSDNSERIDGDIDNIIFDNIQDELIYALSEMLKIDESKVIPEKDIRDYGLDSIRLVNLNNYINETFEIEIAPFVFFENPSIDLLSKFLMNEYKDHFIELYKDSFDHEEIKEKNQVKNDEVVNQQSDNQSNPFNGRTEFLEQSIWLLSAEKELNEDRFLNFWQDLKNKELPPIKRSNVSKEQLQVIENAGYKFLHLMVKNTLGTVMEVYSAGQGEPLLMVTGLGMTAPICLHQIKDFASKYQVIIVNMPGVGLSDGYSDLSLKGLAELVVETTYEMGIELPMHLVGISWGSLLTSKIAHNYPDKIATMTMVGPTTNRSTSDNPSHMMKDKLKMDFDQVSNETQDYELFLKGECIEPISFSQYMLYFTTDSPSPHTNYHYLTQIQTPTLIVAGEHDTIIERKEFDIIYSRIPNSDFTIVEGAGHVVSVTHYQEFNKLVSKFIESQSL